MGFGRFRLATFKYLRQDLRWQVPRECCDIERSDRSPALGINIGERVSDGNLTELERIVDDRWEEIDG